MGAGPDSPRPSPSVPAPAETPPISLDSYFDWLDAAFTNVCRGARGGAGPPPPAPAAASPVADEIDWFAAAKPETAAPPPDPEPPAPPAMDERPDLPPLGVRGDRHPSRTARRRDGVRAAEHRRATGAGRGNRSRADLRDRGTACACRDAPTPPPKCRRRPPTPPLPSRRMPARAPRRSRRCRFTDPHARRCVCGAARRGARRGHPVVARRTISSSRSPSASSLELSERIVRETVADVVASVAERLVREEIERIKVRNPVVGELVNW